jgi:copper chaperone CopZ
MKRLLFVLVMIFMLTACGAVEPPETNNEPSAATTELTVWGMVCTRCENKIVNALFELDGVIDVSADFRADLVTVVHEPELDTALIEGAITAEGFNLP